MTYSYAFVSVENKEGADIAIQEVINHFLFISNHPYLKILFLLFKLNGKTFGENLFNVSIARPRKNFARNNSYNHNNNYAQPQHRNYPPNNNYNNYNQNKNGQNNLNHNNIVNSNNTNVSQNSNESVNSGQNITNNQTGEQWFFL